jgi:hypothetical protein
VTFYLEGLAVWLLGGFVIAQLLGPALMDEEIE